MKCKTIVLSWAFITLSGAFLCSGEWFFSGNSVGDFSYTGVRETVLNPDNLMGLEEVGYSADISVKGVYDGESDSFTVRLGLRSVSLGSGLAAASLGNDLQTEAVEGWASGGDESIYTLSVDELNWVFSAGNRAFITAGRQNFSGGYGYGWNPFNVASALKDPLDPDADLKGTDALLLEWDSGLVSCNLFLLMPEESSPGSSPDTLYGGFEAAVKGGLWELRATGLASPDSPDETYTNVLGMAFFADIMGAGIYGEGTYRQNSRIPEVDSSSALADPSEGSYLSFLAGCEYTFPGGFSLISEYFYNGEGWDDDQRRAYADGLTLYNSTDGMAPSAWYSLYRPGYFAQHYVLLNAVYSFYYPFEINSSAALLYSPDSSQLMLTPNLEAVLSGQLALKAEYSYIQSFDDKAAGEGWLSPVESSLRLSVSYGF